MRLQWPRFLTKPEPEVPRTPARPGPLHGPGSLHGQDWFHRNIARRSVPTGFNSTLDTAFTNEVSSLAATPDTRWRASKQQDVIQPAELERRHQILSSRWSSVTLAAAEPPMTEDPVPYKTARLSHSVLAYAIPVLTLGPKFIGLYLYTSSYGNFDPSKAFFSVKVGKYTLLSNFSVSLTAGALDQKVIEKEYCVTVEQSSLNITFTPSSSIPDAFAFINGIEVVSMPSSLYYSGSVGRQALLVGQQGHMFTVKDTTSLEMMYRINIGGNAISATDDTGMYRQWEKEDEYLRVPGLSVLPVTFDKLTFKDNITSYAAPAVVYTTGRSTGNDKNITLLRSYNLTWEFPVDFG
ncbi:hypothetical protein TIFTF001_033097 [Ficus carica]|uniref:Malectin-like domain-containing protein n=1 Tax=Ficus carica TaxID=3494 RepID=A0AA88J8R3_FICCA|nr:hypothetical protein TIFTF001_033097 [Ficus carica]